MSVDVLRLLVTIRFLIAIEIASNVKKKRRIGETALFIGLIFALTGSTLVSNSTRIVQPWVVIPLAKFDLNFAHLLFILSFRALNNGLATFR